MYVPEFEDDNQISYFVKVPPEKVEDFIRTARSASVDVHPVRSLTNSPRKHRLL